VTVADVATTFAAAPGGAVTLTEVPASVAAGGLEHINIHPTPAGYQVMGQAVINTYASLGVPLSASPVTPRLSVHLARAALHAGALQRVSGATEIGSRVRVVVRLPHQSTARTYAAVVAGNGRFHRAFPVGPRSGQGEVRVCALGTTGGAACSAAMSFRVR
jgi:hypothetical protein